MTKISIYQLLPRFFGNTDAVRKPWGSIEDNGCGKFEDINDNAIAAIKDLGITHIWYTGILQHATTTDYTRYHINSDNPLIVKGRAGSPYAIKNYFDVDPDLAINTANRMTEFDNLIKRTHNHNVKAIIDFIPNHVARCYNSIAANKKAQLQTCNHLGQNDNNAVKFDRNNDFYYILNESFKVPDEVRQITQKIFPDNNSDYEEFPAKVTGNDCFSASPSVNDWYETVKINYGTDYQTGEKHFYPIPHSWLCMYDILKFWCSKNVDGFRCDMAEMVPVEFWQWAISKIKHEFTNIIFIAEIYQPQLYQGFIEAGFDYLYDKVNMYDCMKSIIQNGASVNNITQSWQQTNAYNSYMLRFLENHDEQRIASKFFAGDPFKAIPAFAVEAFMHSGPIMLYNGQELGEQSDEASGFSGSDGRSTIYDYWSFDKQIRWNNSHKFNDENLNNEELALRKCYKEILNFAISEELISKGFFYDLMWINQELASLGCYAFAKGNKIKGGKNKTMVFVVNFTQKHVKTHINISKHVIEFFNMNFDDDFFITIDVDGYGYQHKNI